MADTRLNIRVNAQFDELAQLNAEAQRSRDKIAAMEQAAKILGKTVDTTDAAVEAHIKSLRTLQRNLDQNSKEYRDTGEQIKRYQEQTRDAASATDKAGDSVNRFGDILPNITGGLKNFAAGIAAAFTIDAILNFTQALIDQSLVIKNYAEGTGTSVENISRMSTAAKKAGVDLNDLGDILKDLNEKIAILQLGEGGEQEFNLVRGLKQVGVELQNVDGSYRDAYDILVDYGMATRNLVNDQERAKNATMVLENGNTQFLKSVQNLVEEQGKLPAVTTEQVRAMASLVEQQVEVDKNFQQLAATTMPAILAATNQLIIGFTALSKIRIGSPFSTSAQGLEVYKQAAKYGDDLKFMPPTPTAESLKKLQPLPPDLTRIQTVQGELKKLEAQINAASSDEARSKLMAKRLELQTLLEEMDGTAAKKREQEAEKLAQKQKQEAEKLARAVGQYEADIARAREGYERDIAKIRLDTLKQIQQMEADLQRQKRDAESSLADAILRRDRAQQDRELYMRLRRGDITQQQFDIQTEANRFERENQDAVIQFERERLTVQDKYLENIQKIGNLQINYQERLQELEQRRLDTQNQAAQRLVDQGGTVTDPGLSGTSTSGISYTGATYSSGRRLSYRKLIEVAMSAGFSKPNAIIMAAIAMAESSGDPTASNMVGLDRSYGLWQINMLGAMGPERRRQFGLKQNEDLYDPATNARAAFGLYSNRRDFGDWPTYTQGTYKKFLGDAQQAAAGIGNAVPLPPPDTTNGVPVSLAARGLQQVQQLFALAQGAANKFSPFNQATRQIDLANLETGLFSTNAFDQLRYGGFSGYSPFQNPRMFGQYSDISFAGLSPYPGQIRDIGLQTAQTNLQSGQFASRFNYPSDLTNPQTGALATMQQEYDLAMRRLQLEQQFGQVTADRYIKIQEAARLEMQSLEVANTKLQTEIESGNYQGQTLEVLRNEQTLNNEKIAQLTQLPGLVLQQSQAQQQKLELVQMERQLQVDIANIISTNISQGIMNLIQGTQSLGEVLNNVVMNILNQMLQKFIEMVVQATILKGIMSAFGGGGGGLLGGILSFFGIKFANGGIMTGDGSLPLQRYARGGIARSPQLAMFGEGSKPEAYVPLPDGRSIPVTIRGFADGGIYNPETSGVFTDAFMSFYNKLRGLPDSVQSRRYRDDASYRDTIDKLINEYVAIQYSAMIDRERGNVYNEHALNEQLRAIREQQPDLFNDREFAQYLLDDEAQTFFTGRNLDYLQQSYGLADTHHIAARLQKKYYDDRMNEQQQRSNYMSQLMGGVYDMNYEPIRNRFAPTTDLQKMLGFQIQYRDRVPFGRYAAGGIARSPQLAMFGEGALPEAYVPLPDGRSIPVSLMGAVGGGGNQTHNINNISVNVTASGVTQQSNAEPQGDRLGRAITRAVQEEIMRQQRPGGLLR